MERKPPGGSLSGARQGFFQELNGTFCGILLDCYCGTLQIFNDRMGYEKLYCHNDPATGVFHFASEAKSLLRVIPGTRRV
jgi:asparagine synthetase B (glutamine-hydrolysing)